MTADRRQKRTNNMSLYQSLEERPEQWVLPAQNQNDHRSGERRATVSRRKPQPVINIFIVYENDLNRERACRMESEICRRLGQSFAFSVSWSSLQSLASAEQPEGAARLMASADIICFSLPGGGEIPPRVAASLESVLLGRKSPRLCLLALVETGGLTAPRLSRSEVYLSQLSLAAGVDCLCYSDSIPMARSSHGKNAPPSRKKKSAQSGAAFWRRPSRTPAAELPFLFPSGRDLALPAGVETVQP